MIIDCFLIVMVNVLFFLLTRIFVYRPFRYVVLIPTSSLLKSLKWDTLFKSDWYDHSMFTDRKGMVILRTSTKLH